MLSMSQALEHIKGDTARFLDPALLRAIGQEGGLTFRQRLLTPTVTTHLFVRQVLEGNTSVAELRRLAKVPFAESSYCAARRRLPLSYFVRLHAAVLDRCRRYAENDPRALWRGHRVFFLDGSSFSMPDTPSLQAEFGQSGQQALGCGFPTAHLLVQFHAYTGYLLHAIPAPLRTHDLTDVTFTHRSLARISHQGIERGCSRWHKDFAQQPLCQTTETAS